jgi:hypothetical protein
LRPLGVVVGDQIKPPHAGQNASPGGSEGATLLSMPQTEERLGKPSGVREAMDASQILAGIIELH